MDEFMKINWRLHDLTLLEPQRDFISEPLLAESWVYRHFDSKSVLHPKRPKLKGLFPRVQYIPGPKTAPPPGRPSLLDAWTHDKCLRGLQVVQSAKDPTTYTKSEQFFTGVYNANKGRIQEEQARYQKFAQAQWQRYQAKGAAPAPQALINFGRAKWEAKWRRLSRYPRLYKEVASFNLNFREEDSDIQYQCWSNALDLGVLAQFSCPLLKCPLHLKMAALPPDTKSERFFSNLPVSDDRNIPAILRNHPQIDLVLSISTLKCIADTSDPKRRWMVPVVVKAMPDEAGASRRVVFLNQPLAEHEVSQLDLASKSYRVLLRTTLCQYQAFRFALDEAPLEAEMGPSGRIHHSVCYKVWHIKKTSCQRNLMKGSHKPVQLQVLLRSKLDACEAGPNERLQPVVLRPKLESQLHYGAQLPTRGQLIREWTSLFFTPFANLYRVRIAPKTGELIHVEKCGIQKVAAEAQSLYQTKPQLGLGTLQGVFERLVELAPGNYLLQHLPKHEAFVAVLQAISDSDERSTGETFDLHDELQHLVVNEQTKTWAPLDPNFLLPRFQAENRMPCMFTPKQAKKRKLTK